MKNDELLQKVSLVAAGLDDLLDKTVFVGAAMCPFYIKNPAQELRATVDIDTIIDVKNITEANELERKLRSLGFQNDTSRDAPRCRWIYKGTQVDIVPIADIEGLDSNRWYKEGSRHTKLIGLPSGKSIRILSLPFFIATKLEAFNSRGSLTPDNGSDLEDIILLIDSAAHLEREMQHCPENVRDFIKMEFSKLLKNRLFSDFVANCLEGPLQGKRHERILDRVRSIANNM